jgi:hypothetical protein
VKAFTDGDVERMREALSEDEPRCAPGGCPSREELWQSAAGELDPPEDEPIILHLARCSECSLIWRLAREMLAPEVSAGSVVALRDRKRSKMWRRFLVPAAAAAMLIGVGLGAAWVLRSSRSSPPVFREQHDDTILPSPGTHLLPRAACRLEWSAGPAGTRYDLTVSDGDLEILAAVKGLTRPDYTLPQDAIPSSTAELFWRVTARLPDGRTLSSETFTTTIEDRDPASER